MIAVYSFNLANIQTKFHVHHCFLGLVTCKFDMFALLKTKGKDRLGNKPYGVV